MNRTTIEWTDLSVNPIRARPRRAGGRKPPVPEPAQRSGHYCEMISPGCAHCYASRFQARVGLPQYTAGSHRDEVEVYLDDQVLLRVLRRRKPARIFWCDMSDLFGAWVEDDWLRRILATIALSPQHTHQLLTKRPERMAKWMLNLKAGARLLPVMEELALKLLPGRWWDYFDSALADRPWSNVWLGVSVEDQQRANERLPKLEALHGAGWTTFVSYEPALGDVKWEDLEDAFDWLIAGGESGPGARPMHPDWARHARDFCLKTGKAFFFKQWGEWYPCAYEQGHWAESHSRYTFPEDGQQMVRCGKKQAGRLLDGIKWNQFPEVTHART